MHARIGGLAAASLLVGLLAACTGVGQAAEPAPSATPTPTPTPPAAGGDGQLRIGTMAALTGASAPAARALVAGVELAARELNDAGGVAGQPVLTFHRNSTGADADQASAILDQLIGKGVDIVIGPNSLSSIAAVLPGAIDASLGLITPVVTDPELTALEDAGLVARTVPGVALEGSALAGLVDDGAAVALIGVEDSTTTAIREQLTAALEATGGSLAVSVPVTAETTDLDAIVDQAIESEPDAVVLSVPRAASSVTAGLVSALTEAGVAPADILLTTSGLADYSELAPAGTFTGVRGVAVQSSVSDEFVARLKQADPLVTEVGRAAEAYDAVIAAALAATLAGDDSGASVSYQLPAATGGGVPCGSWAECLDVLTTEIDIDYDGQSGPLAIDGRGDVSAASFRTVEYGSAGTYETVDTQQIG